MCSELEVLARTHGLASALQLLRQRAGVVYPAPMVDCADAHAAVWLTALAHSPKTWEVDVGQQAPRPVGMGLIGHVIDLKLPWLTGHSRATRRVGSLATAADIASHAFERLDGSGYFRGVSATGLPIESRILAAAVAWVALRAGRPWRPALPADEALAALQADGSGERFDPQVLSALRGCIWPEAGPCDPEPEPAPLLTAREREVLRRIALGDSNKEAAKRLDISPSTVRTYLESVFRKLGCKTRAASTLRASMLGLLAE